MRVKMNSGNINAIIQVIKQATKPIPLMIDIGAPAWIFYTSAIFTVLCIVVMVTSAKYSGGGPKNTVNATTEATPAP